MKLHVIVVKLHVIIVKLHVIIVNQCRLMLLSANNGFLFKYLEGDLLSLVITVIFS